VPSFFAAAACKDQTDVLLIVDGYVVTHLTEIKSGHIVISITRRATRPV
jgi:hypothetical protein